MGYQDGTKLPNKSTLKRITRHVEDQVLTEAAEFVRAKAAKYPRQNPTSTYRRTGTLGRSITYGPTRWTGQQVYKEIGTNLFYAKYVEFGVGIYGPERQLIRPKAAQALVWRVSGARVGRVGRVRGVALIAMGLGMRKGRAVRQRSKDVNLVFSKTSRGFAGWHYMEKAFTDPRTEQFMKRAATRGLAQLDRLLSQATGSG